MGEIGAGGELILVETFGYRAPELRSTVENLDHVAVDASRDRLELAHQAGRLDLALDAADTADAANSFEMMLSHQLAAAHTVAMKLAGRAAMHATNAEHDGFGPEMRYPGSRLEFHAVEADRAAKQWRT